MTKKQGKLKKEKKAVKPAKKAAAKKSTPAKASKPAKPARPSGGKAAKPAAKKAVAKKAEKKAVKPVKKQAAPKKAVKPAKPVANAVKAKLQKSTNKPVKPAAKVIVKEKDVKKDKKKEEAGKTITLVVPVKKKAAAEKPVKPEKAAAKKEKPKKEKIKDKPSKKKKKDDDEEEDVEIVDLWETVEEDEEIEVEPKPAAKGKGGRKPKGANLDDDEPVIENDILIEQLIQSTKKLKKPSAKTPVQIRTFSNPMASLTVPKSVENKKNPKKEPKGKFELEYVIRTSAPILYEFLTAPSGLAEWFADDVNIHDGVFTFFWDGSEQKARLLGFKEDKYIKLQWLDKPDGTYFEFRIERDELTGDVSLIITDFADEASDQQTSKLLWDSQVNKLSQVIGSYS
ncbi:MAG: START-like domain-containing protein [Bacteroidia bacterium]